MNTKDLWTLIALSVGLGWAAPQAASAAAAPAAPTAANTMVQMISLKGKVRIEGTSNIDNWQVESRSVEGFMEVAPGFPKHSDASLVPARAEAWLEARSLKSIEKDGKPFSNKMDEIMYEALKSKDNPRIVYRLSRLVPKPGSKQAGAPIEYEAGGQLVVAGVTNELSMVVHVMSLGAHQIKVSGAASVKMTNFQIEPPSPKITLGLIRTGDDVKLSFEWVLISRR